MIKTTSYNPKLYTGRAEPFELDAAQYWYQHVHAFNEHPNVQSIGLLGFASDQGVNRNQGRIGAKYAPDVIKSAFGKLPMTGVQGFIDGDKLSMLVGDCGNVICDDNDAIAHDSLEVAQKKYADNIQHILDANSVAIGLGGGHEIAWGSFLGLWQHLQNQKLSSNIGIINFDAHFDLRSDKYATSGTPFLQISEFLHAQNTDFNYMAIGISRFGNTKALFDKAQTLGVQVISDDECYEIDFKDIIKKIDDFLIDKDIVYLTLDMDCLAGAIMPCVSAVAAFGLDLPFLKRCVKHIINSGKVKVIDIAETCPKYDIDGRGIKVVARLLGMMIEQILVNKIK
ncbi:formimidoylglutamase [Moraxella sp. ZY200743]|uniref:formimidoylglutamase n=1 Tax=Moraxella sp. ZY200743 TaxID=2911970 RepID=UPI003D7E0697